MSNDPYPRRRAARALLSRDERAKLSPLPLGKPEGRKLTVEERELRAAKLVDSRERRSIPVSQFELRGEGNGLRLLGYASVFDTAYDVIGGPPWGWVETVDRRAFDVTLKSEADVQLLLNHEGMPLARTKSGTLKLSTDKRGLFVDAGLDMRDPDVRSLEVKMSRRDIDEMSIGFITKNDAWNEDRTERRILEISLHRGDVSVVNYGANHATEAQLTP
jgi:HK97 family phage prohead protease